MGIASRRFSRTSALADVFVPIRAGRDIVFLGALINYVLTNEKDFREYVVTYTNAAALVDDESWTPRTSTGCSPATTPSGASTTRRPGTSPARKPRTPSDRSASG